MCFSYALQLLCRYELQSAVPFHDDAASKYAERLKSNVHVHNSSSNAFCHMHVQLVLATHQDQEYAFLCSSSRLNISETGWSLAISLHFTS